MTLASFRRLISFLAMCAAAAIAAGCATATKPEAMVPLEAVSGIQHAQRVSVVVAGGSETNSLGKSQISNEAFQQAIVAAIAKNKTFSAVVKGVDSDCRLAVTVINVDQPSFGFSFTVRIEAAWSLKKADGTVIFQESIRSDGMAGATEAFAGVERLRLATEAAARNNIAAGLGKIGTLSF
jgi:opacity protein-like surface antigen